MCLTQINDDFLQVCGLEELPAFDIETRKWELVTTLPDPHSKTYPSARKCHSIVQFTNSEGTVEAVIAGGLNMIEEFDDVWKISLKTFQWVKFSTKLPKKMFFHDACITNSHCMYIFGGVYATRLTIGGRRQIHMIRTRVNTVLKMFVSIPKLRDIAFEAVLQYSPGIEKLDPRILRKQGIPNDFIKRVTG